MLRVLILLATIVVACVANGGSLPPVAFGTPVGLYARNGSAYGTIVFGNVEQGVGYVGGAQFPNVFAVDTSIGITWRTPITVQWTYRNGTYTILPSFDANNTLLGFTCHYDASNTYQFDAPRHDTIVKLNQFKIPRPGPNVQKRSLDGDISGGAMSLARPGTVRKVNGIWTPVSSGGRQVRGVDDHNGHGHGQDDDHDHDNDNDHYHSDNDGHNHSDLDNENKNWALADYYFGWSRDAAACDGAIGWSVFKDPATGHFLRIDYGAALIQPFVEECPCCQPLPVNGLGRYEFTSWSSIPDKAALTLDPICYSGSPLLLQPYCELGCLQ